MKRCPITYEIISDNENYSQRGLKLLSPQLKDLGILNLSAAEQRAEAATRAGKMSVQGVQPKLSARLKVKENRFEIVDKKGQYILKPQSEYYPELAENEAISMHLAATLKLNVPLHGLLYSKDSSMTYFIKRFDRYGHSKKIAVEDFAQLSAESRDTKYNSSMEKIAKIIDQYCTFPKIERVKLLELTLFNFLIGNEDMHLKNFSLMTKGQIVTLSPFYDLLNTTIAQPYTQEEIALPIKGKKRNLKKRDFFDYFAIEHLQLNNAVIAGIVAKLSNVIPTWPAMIGKSFLSPKMQQQYIDLLQKRSQILF